MTEVTATKVQLRLDGAVDVSATEVSAVPRQIEVWGGDLRRPVSLEVEITESGEYLIAQDDLSAFGTGATIDSAIEDFLAMAIDLQVELERSDARLSEVLGRKLENLRDILGRFQ